jgi:anthranilate synthase/aminodeoxychorismate synthase-like glutamine amidotransferase
MVIVIDNYDSFVYNLVQYLGESGWEPLVYRNDKVTLEEIQELRPSHIIISPGPCTPNEAGISCDVIRRFGGHIPILGVCLGHQCIGKVYGGEVNHAVLPTHGKFSLIHHDGKTIYRTIPDPFKGGRYHSLIVNLNGRSPDLVRTAWTDDGEIMGIRHKEYIVEGVQFHPESILTPQGHKILDNFLEYTRPTRDKED